MFEALQERDFRRFWIAQFISNIGSWMQSVAQGWLVYRLTDSPFLLGFVGFANSAPALLLMLPGGVLADQFDRKRVVALSQAAQAACALLLAISIRMDRIAVWQIITAAVIVGIAQSFSAPAFQAMIADLLEERSRLPNAIALNSLQFNFSRALGPLLAGATLTAWGSFWCFFVNALSFVPLIHVLGNVKNRQKRADQTLAMFARMAEGFAFVRGDRVILLLLTVVAAASLFGYPFLSLMPVVARAMFTNDATGIGYLMGGTGAGALAGALALSLRTPGRRRSQQMIVGSLMIFGAALAAVSAFGSPPMIVALLFVCGFTMVTCVALCNTSIQQRVPDGMRGRVLSMYTFAFFAFIPFGNLAAGLIAERRGIATTLFVMGAGLLLSGLSVGVFLATGGRLPAKTAEIPLPRR
jgi:MFS family permease